VFARGKLTNEVDLFVREGTLWRRHAETHVQRAYGREELKAALQSAGFDRVRLAGKHRWWITAEKPL
jgi:hypothetical protein